MKKKIKKKLTPFHMSNEGGKKTLTSTPSPSIVKKRKRKSKRTYSP
jgi:hypothetical protein